MLFSLHQKGMYAEDMIVRLLPVQNIGVFCPCAAARFFFLKLYGAGYHYPLIAGREACTTS